MTSQGMYDFHIALILKIVAEICPRKSISVDGNTVWWTKFGVLLIKEPYDDELLFIHNNGLCFKISQFKLGTKPKCPELKVLSCTKDADWEVSLCEMIHSMFLRYITPDAVIPDIKKLNAVADKSRQLAANSKEDSWQTC